MTKMTTRVRWLAVLVAALVWGAAAPVGAEPGKAKGKAAEKALEKSAKGQEQALDAADGARGDEMRNRRDERKAIMEEAKAAHEPGTPQRGKKPWWRFWESEEDWAAGDATEAAADAAEAAGE